jgi:hypothetical protein
VRRAAFALAPVAEMGGKKSLLGGSLTTEKWFRSFRIARYPLAMSGKRQWGLQRPKSFCMSKN